MRQLSHAYKGGKKTKITAGSLLALAYHLVSRLESLSGTVGEAGNAIKPASIPTLFYFQSSIFNLKNIIRPEYCIQKRDPFALGLMGLAMIHTFS